MIFKGIVAVDSEWGYAKNSIIPWYYKKDMLNFQQLTKNSNVIMGYNTYLEMAKKREYPIKNTVLLKDRLSIIMTSKNDVILSDDAIVIHNFEEIKKIPLKYDVTWLLGGRSIFDYGLNLAVEWYVTTINRSYACDLFFNQQKLKDNFINDVIIYHDDDITITKWITK